MMKWWPPVIVWMGVIFIGSSIGSIPRVGGSALDSLIHRVVHILEFAILGLLVLRALSRKRPVTRREIMWTLIVVAIYGASDEFHQRFTPGRSSEALSVLFDVAGGALGVWGYRWWIKRQGVVQRPAQTSARKTDSRQVESSTDHRLN